MRSQFVWLLVGGIIAGSGAGAGAAERATLRAVQDLPGAEAGARKPTEAELKGVKAAIEAQLKAFKADDYAAAMKYQSSALKDNFETAEDFRRAIKQGYPQFARYRSITYGKSTCDPKGERVAIQVTLVGEDKITVRAVYLMVKEKDGYKVDGVMGGSPPKVDPRDEV